MKKKSLNFIFFLWVILSVASCSDDPELQTINTGDFSSSDWLIPKDDVLNGGPGKDGIPALSDPEFIDAGDASYLLPEDLVLGYKNGDDVRAYPHRILNWHEIVNDNINGDKVAVNYCPLTGTGIAWNRVIDGNETTFGVSGLLYNTNLILYDRDTDSYWSQIRQDAVHGEHIGRQAETFQLVETTWEKWQLMFPETEVVSTQTGFSRDYDRIPYGDYSTNNDFFLFPYSPEDDRLPAKERVLGLIIENSAITYRFNTFSEEVSIVQNVFRGHEILVVGSQSLDFMSAFIVTDKFKDLSFDALSSHTDKSVVMTDNEGNLWNVFGEAISGPRQGGRLKPANAFMGFWFAWGAFYPAPVIYQE
ncbi:MAG: DUF3179 domain-containing protein [Bacteroidota bacterium]